MSRYPAPYEDEPDPRPRGIRRVEYDDEPLRLVVFTSGRYENGASFDVVDELAKFSTTDEELEASLPDGEPGVELFCRAVFWQDGVPFEHSSWHILPKVNRRLPNGTKAAQSLLDALAKKASRR